MLTRGCERFARRAIPRVAGELARRVSGAKSGVRARRLHADPDVRTALTAENLVVLDVKYGPRSPDS